MQKFDASKQFKEIMNHLENNRKRIVEKLSKYPSGSVQFAEAEKELENFDFTNSGLLEHCKRVLAA